ncbi:4-coumarate-CoA ligase 1, partial [Pseudolycoriella hygida]
LWSGYDLPLLFNPRISLGQVLKKFMKVHGSTTAQICDDSGEKMSYNDMWLKTVRAAQNLQKLGYRKGDVFGFSGIHRHLAPVIYAAFSLGCPVNTLSPGFGKADLIYLLNITKPKLMFCTDERYELVAECLKELGNDARIFTFGGGVNGSDSVEYLFAQTGQEHTFLPVPVEANDIAAILTSSGTTGLAKGVALSHSSIAEKCNDVGHINLGDIHYCPGSFYWISGLYISVLSVIHGATAVTTNKKFSAELQLRLVEQYKVTFLMNSPQYLVMMLKNEAIKTTDLSSVKCYFVGGNRVPAGAPAEINKYLPNGRMYTGYGLTEISFILTSTFDEPIESDSSGKVVHGSEVKIIDDNGARCGVGVNGEICIKNRHQFLFYYGNEKATAETIDNEGFVLTGDVGHFDADGYLYIVDRLKDVLKFYLSKVYPSEIESFLINLPDIESVCVVGIPHQTFGDLPGAAVVRKTNSRITEEDIQEMVSSPSDSLSSFQFSSASSVRY